MLQLIVNFDFAVKIRGSSKNWFMVLLSLSKLVNFHQKFTLQQLHPSFVISEVKMTLVIINCDIKVHPICSLRSFIQCPTLFLLTFCQFFVLNILISFSKKR